LTLWDGISHRKEELDALSGANEFTEFYKRLKTIKDYHRKFPNEAAIPMDAEFTDLAAQREHVVEELETMFSGEESFGRFLDLHALFDQFINLKQFEKVTYTQFVNEFDKFHDISREKKTADYKRYLEAVLAYLEGFLKRVKPLKDLPRIFAELEVKFDEDWSAQRVPGWAPGQENDNSLYCVACAIFFFFSTFFLLESELTLLLHFGHDARRCKDVREADRL